ncbi:lamin tail domain-containing protein [Herbidospora sp. NBRC 101105]|uniref:lamin tail domain-containing protein n=1 Tax=Herbidospora sp. NBRC 101105 TaxID=3032195 RepID=UPI0024A01D16|nr:lamin tail domain-containing protein [Herbidospora sp. NBRC 101105]GLX93050.1 hypothetical protein Hesp01_10000 [Herbidospora sp. NBRC 101105]
MRKTWRRTVALALPFLTAVPLLVTQAWAADPVPSIKVNEVESNGGTPGDWVELTNTGTVPVDIGGWLVKDNDDTHVLTIPAGTTVAPGAFLVLDTEVAYGLGGADSVRVFLADGVTLVDSHTWAAHAPVTWGRCPDGTGEFAATVAPTKGAANDCGTPSAFVKINEIESNGGTPGDWVELVNVGPVPVNIGGWLVKDNDDTHVLTVPVGTTVAPGAFLALDTEVAYGLGGADSVRVFLADGVTLVDSHTWAAHAAVTYARCPDGTGVFTDSTAATKGAANTCGAPASTVKINEVESNGGTPGDWVELTNTGAAPVDVSGWIVKDNDDTHVHTIPAGSTITPGGFLPVDVELSYGLGAADSARLYSADGLTLVDSHTWPAHATATYGRCPDGTGAFTDTTAATKGAANACGSTTPAGTPWPGGAGVATADAAGVLGGNMSGLYYQPSGDAGPGSLWAVKNGPGTLYRLERKGAVWTPAETHPLKFPTGLGDPDAEGVTVTPAGVFVSTERDNGVGGVSRPAVLRFDPAGGDGTLTATKEWVLTADLPAVGANAGLEAITWVPDSYLTAEGFVDERTGAAYRPGDYPDHGDGLFLVGVEGTGGVYAYALDQNGAAFTRVATIASGFPGVMELAYDPELRKLWVVCDDTCQGRAALFDVNASGKFAATVVYDRPSGMPNLNNEGFTPAARAECVGGRKPVFWTDDANTGGHALRTGTIDCTPLDLDADDDGIDDGIDPKKGDPANETFSDGVTSGRVLAREGRTVTVSDTAAPAGVLVTVGAGDPPAVVQLTGVFGTVALTEGAYRITGDGRTSTVSALTGQAVVKVTVNGTPVTLTAGAGGSVTLTEVPGNGTVAGITGIEHTGEVTLRATGVPAGACGDIVVRNVVVAAAGATAVSGTGADDLIIGRSADDVITGYGGDDCVVGQGGDDTITTGDGNDRIDAGNGANVVNAGGGDDLVQGGNDADTFDCGEGADVARPLRGANVNVEGRCETF